MSARKEKKKKRRRGGGGKIPPLKRSSGLEGGLLNPEIQFGRKKKGGRGGGREATPGISPRKDRADVCAYYPFDRARRLLRGEEKEKGKKEKTPDT